MLYLYLDESGDLGFDFVNKKPSKYFALTILYLRGGDTNKQLTKAVRKTLARKINRRYNKRRIVQELKGTKTTLEVKEYFYRQIKDINLGIFAVILDKFKLLKFFVQHFPEKERIYSFIAHQVLDQIPIEQTNDERIELIVDKSKGTRLIEEFNTYIRQQLKARIDPQIPIDIYHWDSKDVPGLQACDLFCWGIFQKYENHTANWYAIFKEKIMLENFFVLK